MEVRKRRAAVTGSSAASSAAGTPGWRFYRLAPFPVDRCYTKYPLYRTEPPNLPSPTRGSEHRGGGRAAAPTKRAPSQAAWKEDADSGMDAGTGATRDICPLFPASGGAGDGLAGELERVAKRKGLRPWQHPAPSGRRCQ